MLAEMRSHAKGFFHFAQRHSLHYLEYFKSRKLSPERQQFFESLSRETLARLLEMLGMLADGTLLRPLDIFDLLMHGTPAVLLMIRLYRQFVLGNKAAEKK